MRKHLFTLSICLLCGLTACSDDDTPTQPPTSLKDSSPDVAVDDMSKDINSPNDMSQDMPQDISEDASNDMTSEDMAQDMPASDMMDDMPLDPCANQVCSNHGQCVVINDTASCQCDEGYVPDGLNCVEAPAQPTLIVQLQGPDFTTEAGGSTSLNIQLSAKPTNRVTIPVALSRPNEGASNVVSLTIVPDDWNVPQNIVITGVDDGVADGDQMYRVLFGPTQSTDPDFDKLETSLALLSKDLYCGDGVKNNDEDCDQPGANPQCDYGQQSCQVCDAQCKLVPGQVTGFCGDATVNGNEQCDQPGANQQCAYGQQSCQVCDAQCQLVPGQVTGFCGDAAINGNEQCDVPNGSADCAYGQQSCQVCNAQCQLVPGNVVGFCGDSTINGNEQCDQPGASQQCAYGQQSCQVCSAQCQLVQGLPGGFCGDATVNGNEQCDQPGASQQCAYGQQSCQVCNAQCQLVQGQPAGYCGDGVVNGNEPCDGTQFQAQFVCPQTSAGTVTCAANCKISYNNCRRQGQRLAVGLWHACGITPSTALKCWGRNHAGQIGDNTTTDRATAKNVSGLNQGVVSVAAGGGHTCAVLGSGSVKCWGDNQFGQLATGNRTNKTSPGQNSIGLTLIEQIVLGKDHSCALTSAGGVLCWGRNQFGQLGDGTLTDRVVPTPVQGLSQGVQMLQAGYNHTCARLNDSTIRCWGQNDEAQLGDGTTVNRRVPTTISYFDRTAGRLAVGVGLGMFHSCAQMHDGALKCWGNGNFGRLGNGATTNSTIPVDVNVPGVVNSIDASLAHTCVTTTQGDAYCWGFNAEGRLGDGTPNQRTVPTRVNLPVSALQVQTGDAFSCAMVAGQSVYCWGSNLFGQIGNNSMANSLSAARVLNF